MLFALVDCNNFYASCERAFNPSLENQPVVILSNNDGCIISRSNEAKKLKIPMGAPFYQWKSFCVQHKVHVFSSNYELYGDMSQRVMTLLKEYDNRMEIYSIDEAFLLLNDKISFLELVNLRNSVTNGTGIPISIGVAQTKTLAKMANHIAKNSSKNGVFFLNTHQKERFATFPVQKIWGIGYKLAEKLNKLNIDTAQKLQAADPKMIRLHSSVNLEKIVRELNGTPCIPLEKYQPRKQIICSRSFGKVVTELADLEEAVSHYIHNATRKLRKQHSVASGIVVFLQTNIFNDQQPQHANSMTYPLTFPTADTGYLISIAKECLRRLYKKDYRYHKAGIMLLDISQEKTRQYDLLSEVINKKSECLMQTMDNINSNMGKNTIFLAAEGTKRSWVIKCDRRSPRYTTRWEELAVVG
jgi:DNA polymerase V